MMPRPCLFSLIIHWFPFGATKAFVIVWYTAPLNKIHHYQLALFLAVYPAVRRVFLSKTTAIFESKSKFAIRHNFTFTSSNFVYCRPCSKCHELCIGETARYLSDRFAEHLPSVRNDVDKSITWHFNCSNHSISDMKVFVISSISVGNNSRRRQERRLVFNLETTHPYGFNQRFSII